MCNDNPRNCALRDNHTGPCVTALQLNKLVDKGTQELLHELDQLNTDQK